MDGRRDRSFETTNRLLLADDEIPAHGFAANHASTAVSTRAATSSTVPSALTTSQRSGSAAASSRYPSRTGCGRRPGTLDAIHLIAEAHSGHRPLDVEQHGEIRLDAVGRESHHGVELIEIEPASVALVGGARCGVAIGHDRLASLERRTDDLGDMLGLVGDDKQGFGPIVERGMRDRAGSPESHCRSRSRRTGRSTRRRSVMQGGGPGSTFRSVGPFEHDQSAGHALGSDSASARNAPDPARKLHIANPPAITMMMAETHGEAYSRHEDRQSPEHDLTPPDRVRESVEEFGEDRCVREAIRTQKRTSTSSEAKIRPRSSSSTFSCSKVNPRT